MGVSDFIRNPELDLFLFEGKTKVSYKEKEKPVEKKTINVNPETIQDCDFILSLSHSGFLIKEWKQINDEGDIKLCKHRKVVFGETISDKRCLDLIRKNKEMFFIVFDVKNKELKKHQTKKIFIKKTLEEILSLLQILSKECPFCSLI